jgi:hypothetical protein
MSLSPSASNPDRVRLFIALLLAFVLLGGVLLVCGCEAQVDTQPPASLQLRNTLIPSAQPFELEVSGTGLNESSRAVLTRDLGNRRFVKSALRLWGTIVGIMLQGDYAYVANNTKGLVVVDIRNPAAPEVAGSLLMPGKTLKVLPHGNLLLAANEASGIQLVDISEPARPTLISALATPGRILDLDISAALVFAAAEKEGLLISDVSNSVHPVILSQLRLPGRSLAIKQIGHYVYLAGTEVLAVVDVSDPRHPILRDSIPLEHNGFSIASYADKLLVALGSNGVLIVDIHRAGQLKIVDQLRNLGHVVRITVEAGRAYLASTFGTLVLDLESSPAPGLLGGVMGNHRRVTDVASRHGIVWVADNYSGLEVLDLSQPEAFAFNRTPGRDQRLLQVTSTGQGLANLQTDENLLTHGQIETRTMILLADIPQQGEDTFFVSDGYAAVQRGPVVYLGTDQGLLSLDLSDPDHPRVMDRGADETQIVGLALAGETLYAAAGESGLLIFTLSEGIPQLVSQVPTQDFASGIAVAGNFIYLSEQKAGLNIFNVSDPSQPILTASSQYPYPLNEFSLAADVALYQGVAYVADGPNGLMVVDVSDPMTPDLVALVKSEDYARSIVIKDRRLYLSDSRGGVRSYDIAQPDRPLFVCSVHFPISAQACAVDGDSIGISARSAGLFWVEKPVEATATHLQGDGSARFAFPPVMQPGHYDLRVFNDAGGEDLPGAVVIRSAGEGT